MALKKILVVEDNEDNRRILVYRLKKIGQFDIREATNGQEAIDAVKADPPDLIFMDLKMPVMDGWEATKRIRQMEGGSAVRIIALTAQAMAGDEEKALAIGCDDYLAKPVVDPSLVAPEARAAHRRGGLSEFDIVRHDGPRRRLRGPRRFRLPPASAQRDRGRSGSQAAGPATPLDLERRHGSRAAGFASGAGLLRDRRCPA